MSSSDFGFVGESSTRDMEETEDIDVALLSRSPSASTGSNIGEGEDVLLDELKESTINSCIASASISSTSSSFRNCPP